MTLCPLECLYHGGVQNAQVMKPTVTAGQLGCSCVMQRSPGLMRPIGMPRQSTVQAGLSLRPFPCWFSPGFSHRPSVHTLHALPKDSTPTALTPITCVDNTKLSTLASFLSYKFYLLLSIRFFHFYVWLSLNTSPNKSHHHPPKSCSFSDVIYMSK